MASTRVLVVSPHALPRAGWCALIAARAEFAVVGDAATADEAVAVAARTRPDVVLLDAGHTLDPWVPLLDRDEAPPRVLFVAADRTAVAPAEAIDRGVHGVLLADAPADHLFKALRKLHEGEYWLERAAFAGVLARRRQVARSPEQVRLASLTPREREVVALMGEGLRNGEVAARLRIREATVRNHLTSILDKLDVPDRVALALFALRHGVLPCPGCGRTHEGG
jgi:DNA-binding NarL/FixJ family response regulator